MAEVNGNTFTIYQGDDANLGFTVTTGTPAVAYDLTGGKATLTYWLGTAAAVNLPCTISTSTVTAPLTHAVTKLLTAGLYDFQLCCKNAAGATVMTKVGYISVLESKNAAAVE